MTLSLSEWEVMVLRAALERHAKPSVSPKHRDTARELLRRLRLGDNPMKVVAGVTGESIPA